MELTTEVLELHPYLFKIAYSMLGEVQEAEDIVQDVYEILSRNKEISRVSL